MGWFWPVAEVKPVKGLGFPVDVWREFLWHHGQKIVVFEPRFMPENK